MKSLFIRRLQNFMITLYKSLFFTNYPGYLKDMFTRTVFILQFALKSYPGPFQPKNNDLRSAFFFILS